MVDVTSTLTNLVSVNTAANSIAAIATLLTVAFVGFGIAGIFLLIIWKTKAFVKYPNKSIILKLLNGQLTYANEDRIRAVKNKKENKEQIEFKSTGQRWTPTTHEAFVQMKKGAMLFLKELSEGQFEIIDPRVFITARPEEYRKFENESANRFFKTTEDAAVRNKYKSTDQWAWLKDNFTLITCGMLLIITIYIMGQFFITPFLQQQSQYTGVASTILDKATQLMDAQTRYMEVLLRQQGIASPLNLTNTTYGNSSVIP